MATLTRRPGRSVVVLTIVAVALAIGCTPSSGPGPSGSPSASVSPSATGDITTPEAAAAVVLALDPRFAGIRPSDPNVIGACCSWSAVPAAGGAWTVTLEIGWGDCPAGCINRHQWVFEVAKTGTVSLVSEAGPPVPAGVGGGGDGTGPSGFRGHALAGPTCPVVRPNDPACADRPIAGATIHVLDSTGTEIGRLVTDVSGAFALSVPAGSYQLVAEPVEGVMHPPAPVTVEVGSGVSEIDLSYDTGIR